MSKNNQSFLSGVEANNTSSASVLGRFQINHQQFLVVSLEPDSSDLLLSLQSDRYEELQRFNVQGRLCAIVKPHHSTNASGGDIVTVLTERELQIATLVASGHANKQIAKQLRISEWTVSTHLRRIFIKLHVDSRAAMVYHCAPLINLLNNVS
jgi:DNA-binding NarL/FixJ family response regulator